MKIKDLLTDESKWTKGWYARDEDGHAVRERDISAVCWCLVGAAHRCYGQRTASNKLNKLASMRSVVSISEWQDVPERTFQEVHDLIVEADV